MAPRTTGLLIAVSLTVAALTVTQPISAQATADHVPGTTLASEYVESRRASDYAALQTYRPGFSFWQHIFTIPDGRIAFGSAVDGRLLAVFPSTGDWAREGEWKDPALSGLLDGVALPRKLDDRRDQVAALIAQVAGPVVHNPTRGQFVVPNARRYGSFLREWGAIYERFGVPAEIGLAQAVIESGLHPTIRSEARAIGLCQWKLANWRRLNELAHAVIEGHNQTTQASYCAAYLSVLATRYGSFIPALSEHHSGGTNVGRTLINGARLGGEDIRDRYFLGSQLARDLRQISLYGYRDMYRTYGPRSYFYSEMVFGNTLTVTSLMEAISQDRIYAMRAPRAIALAEIARRTRLSTDEVQRFNPALVKRVPAGATLYLPSYIKEFGRDVAFWHRPPSAAYAEVLNDFVRLDAMEAEWDDPAFESTLRAFQKRFAATRTEEGTVMATVIAYTIDETYKSTRGAILAEYRADDDIQQLFERAVVERNAERAARVAASAGGDADATQ